MKNVSILKKKLVPSMVAAALAVGTAAGVAHAYEGMATQGSEKDRGEKRQGQGYDKKNDSYKKDKDMDRRGDDGATTGHGAGHRPDPTDATAPPRQIGGPGNEK